MFRALLAPDFQALSKRRTLLCMVALLSLCLGNAWAKPAQPANAVLPRATSGSVSSAPPTASITASQLGAGTSGTTQSQTHVITNNGGAPETFNLSIGSRQAWTVSVTPSQVLVAPGASKTITASVTIPNDAPPGMVGLTIITATNTLPAPPIVLQVRDTMLVTGTAALKIPAAQMGQLVNGKRQYSLTEARGTTRFLPGLDTPTAGYNGTFLGPTLVMTKEETISLSVTNSMTEVTTTHWHGIHLPGQTDGGPHQVIEPGATWRPSFTMINEASTAWYHPHPHAAEAMSHMAGMHPQMVEADAATTGNQVYAGLAGMIIIRDSASAALGLPHSYGVDEFPVVVQDRNFNADGSFRPYPAIQDRDLHKGDYFLVNGTLAGNLSAPAQMVRLHILNGSNARFYNFGFSDNRSFYQIASDNGLLNQRVSRNRVVLGPGERAEIVVDLSGDQGRTLRFVNYAYELTRQDVAITSVDDYDQANYILFSIQVTAPTAQPVTSIPTTLNHIARLSASQSVMTRTLTLNIPPSINGQTFSMDVVNITTTLGTKEVWSIVNLSEEAHPIHIHDSPFQILSRNGAPPPAYELGWKDTVIVHSLERVDLIKDFSGYADPEGPFMYHCHILDHEDKGMMGQFIIIDGRAVYLPLVRR
jgi:bilirubin oxidase